MQEGSWSNLCSATRYQQRTSSLCVCWRNGRPVLCRSDGLNISHPCGICKHPRIFPRTLKKYLTYHFITPNFRQLNCIQLKTSDTNLIFICPYPASHQRSCVACLKRLVLKRRLLPSMPSATDFFSTAKKRKQKMPLSNAERLAQRKSLCGSHQHALACEVGCPMNVGCETALRAVLDGFI